jgi:hypothetical protein
VPRLSHACPFETARGCAAPPPTPPRTKSATPIEPRTQRVRNAYRKRVPLQKSRSFAPSDAPCDRFSELGT